MHELIEELVTMLAAATSRLRTPRPRRADRRMRPQSARSTFRPADPQVSRRLAV
jgi:hypothetical protein